MQAAQMQMLLQQQRVIQDLLAQNQGAASARSDVTGRMSLEENIVDLTELSEFNLPVDLTRDPDL